MDHPFIQILRFEWKANKINWILISSIGILLILILCLLNSPVAKIFSISFLYSALVNDDYFSLTFSQYGKYVTPICLFLVFTAQKG